MSNPEYSVTCEPSKDFRTVVLTISSTEVMGMRTFIKCLAGFIKQQIEKHGISYSDVAWKRGDSVNEVPHDL